MVREVLIICFKDSEISGIFIRCPRIFSEKDTVLVFGKELTCCLRLASKVGDNCSKFHHYIWTLVEQISQSLQVICQPAEMCSDECSIRIVFKEKVLLEDHLLK